MHKYTSDTLLETSVTITTNQNCVASRKSEELHYSRAENLKHRLADLLFIYLFIFLGLFSNISAA
jgi:hypothetical protein